MFDGKGMGVIAGGMAAVIGLSFLRTRMSRSASQTSPERRMYAAMRRNPFASVSRAEESLPPEVAIVAKKEGAYGERLKFIKDDYEKYKKELRDYFEEVKKHPVKSYGRAVVSAASGSLGDFSLEEKVGLFTAFRTLGKEGVVAELTRLTLKKPRVKLGGVASVPNPVRYVTLDKKEIKAPTPEQIEAASKMTPEEFQTEGKGWLSSLFSSKKEAT